MVDSEIPKAKLVNTQMALAAALHISRSRITAYRKHPMWKFDPPFDVETVRRWITAYIKIEHCPGFARYARVEGRIRNDAEDSLYAQTMELKEEQLKLLRARRIDLESKTVDRDFHERTFRAYTKFVESKLSKWVQGLPSALSGCSESEARDVLTNEYDAFCDQMHAVTQINVETCEEV